MLNTQNYLTHHIEEAGVLTRVGTKYFTKLHGIHIRKGGYGCRILLYDDKPDYSGRLLQGMQITETYMLKELDCTAYNGLYYLVLVDRYGFLGDYTLHYS